MASFDIETYKEASDWGKIPAEFLEPALEETVGSEEFPGFVLPAWVGEDIRWYAVAINQRQWRLLQPILLAYVGNTVSTFAGEASKVDPAVKAEEYLASLDPYAIARLEAPRNEMFASRALQRMKDTLLARPTDLRPPPMSTAHMLSNFDMCLVEGNRKGALHWLSRLKIELRLDAINLSFTRVKFHATFRDWESILSNLAFAELCRVKKPAIIAHHLLEAIWFCHLERFSGDKLTLEEAFERECKNYVSDILASTGMPSEWAADRYSSLIGLGSEIVATQTGVLFDAAGSKASADIPAMDDNETGLTNGGDELGTGDHTNGTDEYAPPVITDWLTWLQALELREFGDFNDIASDLALTFDVSAFQDPEDIRKLTEAIFDLDSERAVVRLHCSLPNFLKWLKSDPEYPRNRMVLLYEVILWRLIDARNREGEFREAFSELLAAMLEVGLSEAAYRSLLDHVLDAIPPGAGTDDVFWLLDLAEVLCRFSAPNENIRKTALNKILNSLEPVNRQISPVQRSAYLNIGAAAGWEIVQLDDEPSTQSIADMLKGKLVGIYTLTESAGRQAATVLKSLAPDVKVEVSSEKVSTQRLTRLSQNADIMVITASSATHAATDCIHHNRATERILYAAGRGCGSILRAIEDHLSELDQFANA
jgi:hypothetical protein